MDSVGGGNNDGRRRPRRFVEADMDNIGKYWLYYYQPGDEYGPFPVPMVEDLPVDPGFSVTSMARRGYPVGFLGCEWEEPDDDVTAADRFKKKGPVAEYVPPMLVFDGGSWVHV